MQNDRVISVKIHRKKAMFLYFILESNEGLCSFTTRPKDNDHQIHRIVDIYFDESLKSEVQLILSELDQKLELEYLD